MSDKIYIPHQSTMIDLGDALTTSGKVASFDRLVFNSVKSNYKIMFNLLNKGRI